MVTHPAPTHLRLHVRREPQALLARQRAADARAAAVDRQRDGVAVLRDLHVVLGQYHARPRPRLEGQALECVAPRAHALKHQPR
jgi:hypothetical protein